MRIGVPKETAPGERRVALVPESGKKLRQAGYEIAVEAGAGEGALIPDALYEEAGARIGNPWRAEVVAKVAPPIAEEIGRRTAEAGPPPGSPAPRRSALRRRSRHPTWPFRPPSPSIR
jgi:NAD(P) transhydrogenase subunit alpha